MRYEPSPTLLEAEKEAVAEALFINYGRWMKAPEIAKAAGIADDKHTNVVIRRAVRGLVDEGEAIISSSKGFKFTLARSELFSHAKQLEQRARSIQDRASRIFMTACEIF